MTYFRFLTSPTQEPWLSHWFEIGEGLPVLLNNGKWGDCLGNLFEVLKA